MLRRSGKNLKFLVLFVAIFYLKVGNTQQIINGVFVSCDYQAATDQSACIQKYIDLAARKQEKLYFKNGMLQINKSIILRNNIKIVGNKTIIKLNFSIPYQSAFLGKNVSNISIQDIAIKSDGVFSSSKFSNKYISSRSAIGYTNLDKGISIYGYGSNILIKNIKISGVERAIDIDNGDISSNKLVQKVVITGNQINNVGKVAIRVVNSNLLTVNNNIISEVLGNMDDSVNFALANTKFADGIYLSGVKNASIKYNQITNVIRIGIVLEGDEVNNTIINKNDYVKIIGNKIYNVNNCRGTENNAGIWIEPSATPADKFSYKTGTVIVANNFIDNARNTVGCANNQYGVFLGAKNNIVRSNIIINFTAPRNYAINNNYGTVELTGNQLKNNRVDIYNNPKAYYLKIQ